MLTTPIKCQLLWPVAASNLFVSMLNRMRVKTETFGQNPGTLSW